MTFLLRLPCILLVACCLQATSASAQVTTTGFQNVARPEAPGTLLSHPIANGSEPIGRTTSLNYLNGWVVVGGEAPGSRPGSDLVLRVYDISNPANPVRRLPSDFGLAYPSNRWHQGNVGWNAHGTAQWGNLLLPQVMRVSSFGGLVELGGTNGIPDLGQVPVRYNRSSQAGPWEATLLWYGTPDQQFLINRVFLNASGYSTTQTLATFDHVGPYGGGDWHPMFFGDLLIYARSGSAARDGVVVYRLLYQNFDDANPANDTIVPQYVASLEGGFEGYWPNLFSDGTGLYVIGSSTNVLVGANVSAAAEPGGEDGIQLTASLTVPNFTNASYPVYQDQFGFIHNRKIDMTRFLAGDANPIVLTLNEAANGVDTSQMSLPLGNLWLTGGYPGTGVSQGMGVWVHQQAADTTPPRVTYHLPQANRTSYPRHAPLSFLLHEHPRNGGPRNGIDFAVRPVAPGNVLGAAVSGFLIHDFSGNLTFTPEGGLTADTTYQVDFFSDPANQIGFRDAAGNYIEAYSFRFSTGGGINATTPPVLTSVSASTYQPAPGATVVVSAAATGSGPLQYRFNFNGTWTAWSESASAEHIYATSGRPRVLVQVRDANGQLTNGSLRLLVITPPPAGPRPTQSSSLAIGDDPAGRRLWVVNPDANTVSVLDPESGAKLAEHAVGLNPRSIARDAQGRYWITCHGSDEIRVLNPDGSAHAVIDLPYGSAPFGVAASPSGQNLFVTMCGSGRLHRYLAANPASPPTIATTFPTARAIAVSANGARVLVTRFISPELEAEIAEFAGTSANLDLVRTLRLASANPVDGGDRASGVPNYLAGIAISPDGTRAAVVSKQDNIQRGTFFGVGNLTHETTVRSVISFLDLTANAEIQHTRRDFDNSDSPTAVTYTPMGDLLLVTLQGNNRLVGIDALNLAPIIPNGTAAGSTEVSPAVIGLDVETGLAPQGVLLDAPTNRLFTQNFMGRSVTIRDATPLLGENRTTLPPVATTVSVASELLSPQVLQGKRIFYNAADARMSADSYISCASCHVDGGHDGRVWDFTGRGEGFRRTTDLRGRSGMGNGNVHWSGNFDEIQDFEHDIRGPFGGTGFLNLTPQEFALQHPSPATGTAGLSADLDALAAYVTSLTPEHVPRSPSRAADGALTEAAVRGRAVFQAQNCVSCHSGPLLTNSATGSIANQPLFNTGTQSSLSGSRLGQALGGIDTPSLHGLHDTRVYLHHGQAETLSDVFQYAGGALLLPAAAQLFGGAQLGSDQAAQGGGGFSRGFLSGAVISLAAQGSGVRFQGVDGGAGGTARIAIRYVRQYGNATAALRVNGAEQTLNVLRQYPDNGWQISGWRWITVEAPLNPGTANVLEVVRGNGELFVNAVLVSNATTLALAQPHRLVAALPAGQRDDLFAYLRQADGRDDAGVPLAAPALPGPQPPSIVSAPSGVALAVGNSLHFTVAVAGTGPFGYQWFRGATPVGENSPALSIPSVTLVDAGNYTVQVSNAQGSVTSGAAQVTVNPALAISTTSLPSGRIGSHYEVALAASGGVGSRTWTLDQGVLLPGLSLSASGQLSGVPRTVGRTEFTVRVTDSSGSVTRTFVLTVGRYVVEAPDPDLILHYTFDEGSGAQVWDSAPGGNNHSTNVPGASWVANGRFDGASGPTNTAAAYAPFFPANQSDLNFEPRADPFSIAVWVRTTAAGGYNTIIGKDRGGAPWDVHYRLWMVNTGEMLQGVNGNQYGGSLSTSASPLNNGQWHLVTLVNELAAGSWRTRVYYDDGTLFTQFSTGAGGAMPTLMRVGDTTLGWNPWLGQIDDLRIYRRALSPSEISALYHAPDTESFGEWLVEQHTASELMTATNVAPDGDANRNGVPNLLEFAVGDPSGSELQISFSGAPGSVVAQITFTRNTAARGGTLILESSVDLAAWSPLATSVNGGVPVGPATIVDGSGTIRQTVVRVPVSSTGTFFRLRAVEN